MTEYRVEPYDGKWIIVSRTYPELALALGGRGRWVGRDKRPAIFADHIDAEAYARASFERKSGKEKMKRHYFIERDPSSGQFVIVHNRRGNLAWSHGHWINRQVEQPDGFADQAAATAHAARLFEYHAGDRRWERVHVEENVADPPGLPGVRTNFLYDVGILADDSTFNPYGYPEDLVRAAVNEAEKRLHEERSAAAKEAAKTRAKRREKKVNEEARRMAAKQGIGERRWCYICGKHLSDPVSISRGIGSECWQDVLATVERLKASAISA